MKKYLLALLFATACYGQHDAVTVLQDGLGHGTINTPGVNGAVLPYYYMGPFTYDFTGSTLINATTTTVTNYSQTIVQANTFVAGTPVTVNGSGVWVACYATGTLANANAIGIVSAGGLSATQFTVVTQGVCNVGGSSLTPGSIYYVPLVQGTAVTSTAPSTAGQYVYPLATATTSSILYVSTSTPSVVYALGVGANSVTFGSGGTGSSNYVVYVNGGSGSNGGASLQFERNGSVTGGVGTYSGLFGGSSSDTTISAATGNNIDFYYGGTPTLVGQFTSTGLSVPLSTASTTYQTGAIVDAGGLGVAGAIYGNSTLNLAGQLNANATTASSSYTTGAIVDAGGLGVAGSIYGNTNLNIAGTSTLTGNVTVGAMGSGNVANSLILYGSNASNYGPLIYWADATGNLGQIGSSNTMAGGTPRGLGLNAFNALTFWTNNGTLALTLDTSQNATFAKEIVGYNGLTTAGLGVAVPVASANITAQSSNATITSFANPATDADYEVAAQMSVTASTTLITTLTCTYTDVASVSRTMIMPIVPLTGTFVAAGAITGAGASVWETPHMHIRAKASTTITLLTSAGTFTGVTYSASGTIIKLN